MVSFVVRPHVCAINVLLLGVAICVPIPSAARAEASIEEIFSPATPAVLPAFVPNLFAPERAAGATGYVDVEFDITQFGTTRRIRVLDTTRNASKTAEQRISRWIVENRFRPRMADGQVAEAARVAARHYVHE